jgi:hypothetical protein
VAFGSDTIFPHETAAREFGRMVKLGLAPLAAIRAATTSAAQVVLRRKLAQWRRGTWPTSSPCPLTRSPTSTALERVSFVMRAGKVVRKP